jgi:hypothetical protein
MCSYAGWVVVCSALVLVVRVQVCAGCGCCTATTWQAGMAASLMSVSHTAMQMHAVMVWLLKLLSSPFSAHLRLLVALQCRLAST